MASKELKSGKARGPDAELAVAKTRVRGRERGTEEKRERGREREREREDESGVGEVCSRRLHASVTRQ